MGNKFDDELYNQQFKIRNDGKVNKHSLNKASRIAKVQAQINAYMNNPSYTLAAKSIIRGQLSRMQGCVVKEYDGKYGKGVVLDAPYFGHGSQYFQRYYFIIKSDDEK